MILTIYKKDHESVKRIMSFEFQRLPNQTESDIISILMGLSRENMSLADFMNVPINILNVVPPLQSDHQDLLLTNIACIDCIDEVCMFFTHPKHMRVAQ